MKGAGRSPILSFGPVRWALTIAALLALEVYERAQRWRAARR